MAAKKKGAPAPRPRSGFVTEEQRHTKRIVLRLDPETEQRLRSFAFEHGWSLSETVSEAFKALERELEEEFVENARYCPHDVMLGAGVCDECQKEG
jgi:macrodomain Ter protein organizer (MatP/YcbG family)